MAAPTQHYVDPALAADSGIGTQANPFGDLQYAIDSINGSHDTVNGDQFNVIAGADEILTAPINIPWTPTGDAQVIFRGCTSTAGDGGIGQISGNGSVSTFVGKNYVHWRDLKLHNTGGADVIKLGAYQSVCHCEITDSNADGIGSISSRGFAYGNHIHNIGLRGIQVSGAGSFTAYNYLQNSGGREFLDAITLFGNDWSCHHNIISVTGASNGISLYSGVGGEVYSNSIFSAGGTGRGLFCQSTARNATIHSNLVEGFSGSGGRGYDFDATTLRVIAMFNAAFNNSVDFEWGDLVFGGSDNASLTGTPFEKSGADSFANRFTYFAPSADAGGAYPSGANASRGAVQAVAGGGGTVTKFVPLGD